jgi:hypothetical protein
MFSCYTSSQTVRRNMLLGFLQIVVFLNVFQDKFKRDSYTSCKSMTKKNTEMSIDATRGFA